MGDKVLVIDDSALMRKHLRAILDADGYEVETARNGVEGLEKIAEWNPDLITLDINMPEMDGLTCLSHIMNEHPRPVIMVSSLTEKGALATLEALELGAVNYVAKPGGTVSLNIRDIADDLLEKLHEAKRVRINKSRGLRNRLRNQRESLTATHNLEPSKPKRIERPRPPSVGLSSKKFIGIGVSTGGPGTVEEILHALDADFPLPIVIIQHMPAKFTRVFANRLDKTIALDVIELEKPMPLLPGQVVIARGDSDAVLIKRGGKILIANTPAVDDYHWHPSVDRFFESVLELCDPTNFIGVELTGMGRDGADPLAELHKLGARTIAESEETAVVYGMPRELVELNGADKILPSYKIAEQLIEWSK